MVLHGRASAEIPALAKNLQADAVYTNRDYEPQAILRDAAVAQALSAANIAMHTFKDQVIFEADEVLTQENRPYSVFTPYKKRLAQASKSLSSLSRIRLRDTSLI